MQLCQEIAGKKITNWESMPERTGEVQHLVADIDMSWLANFGGGHAEPWQPIYSMYDIISSAWKWEQRRAELQKQK